MILYMYIAAGQGHTNPRDKILMSTERPYHFAHLLHKFQNISLKSDFICIFSCFYTYIIYSPGPEAGADNPLGSNFFIST